MMSDSYTSRQIQFEEVLNFRDLGGFKTRNGHMLVWRKLFRSGELQYMTGNDFRRLKEEIRLAGVIDLRSTLEVEQQGLGMLKSAGLKYHNISLIPDGGDREGNERRYKTFTHMGEFYVDLLHQPGFAEHILDVLEIIATADNHPLVFHCSAGKDRTGIIAAVLLSLLGVEDEEIIRDYTLSEAPMQDLIQRMQKDPKFIEDAKSLPDYFWRAEAASMAHFLSSLRAEYGSIPDYLQTGGASPSLVSRLEQSLLTR